MNAESGQQIVWGADAIAKAISRPVRATYHMLENGTLPGAKKVGGRWCFVPATFFASLATTSAETRS